MGPTPANRSYTVLRSRFAKVPTRLSGPLRQHIGWASGTPPHTGTPLTAQGGGIKMKQSHLQQAVCFPSVQQ